MANKETLADAKFLKIAEHIARTRSSIKRYQTGAVIVQRKEIVGIGWSHRSGIRYSQTPFSCHAELHAISRPPKASLVGATIYIVTISRKSGNITSGKPCGICRAIIYKVGIERVVHS